MNRSTLDQPSPSLLGQFSLPAVLLRINALGFSGSRSSFRTSSGFAERCCVFEISVVETECSLSTEHLLEPPANEAIMPRCRQRDEMGPKRGLAREMRWARRRGG